MPTDPEGSPPPYEVKSAKIEVHTFKKVVHVQDLQSSQEDHRKSLCIPESLSRELSLTSKSFINSTDKVVEFVGPKLWVESVPPSTILNRRDIRPSARSSNLLMLPIVGPDTSLRVGLGFVANPRTTSVVMNSCSTLCDQAHSPKGIHCLRAPCPRKRFDPGIPPSVALWTPITKSG